MLELPYNYSSYDTFDSINHEKQITLINRIDNDMGILSPDGNDVRKKYGNNDGIMIIPMII